MIPKVESFSVRTTTRDAYGKVTVEADKVYYGVIDRQTQYRSSNGQTVIIGEGMIFSDELEEVNLMGQEIIIDSSTWTVTQVYTAMTLGTYHHTEITYG